MRRKNSFYKGIDLLNDNNRERMNNYFNPYEYNFESNNKDEINSDITCQKSKSHNERKQIKNR